ncbi:MAG: hypothetical protein IJ849_12520 [Selenomonadaceae bacterium]|nr:hypothetical protein [Selenomonadaceae bacterium]
MTKDKRLLQELTPEEQRSLHRLYGMDNILAIEELSGEEAAFFRPGGMRRAGFVLQTLYKLATGFSPADFDAAVRDAVAREECLRTNYPVMGGLRRKVILAGREGDLDIVYRDLRGTPQSELNGIFSRLMEANTRQEMDLAVGLPLRLAVFRTGEAEYAVLVTFPFMFAEVFSPRRIFAGLTGKSAAKITKTTTATAPEANTLSESLRDFPPPPNLPFSKPTSTPFRQRSYQALIPPSTWRLLTERTESGAELIAALALAWGEVLLAEGAAEVGYPILLPLKENKAGNLSLVGLPIRLQKGGLSWAEAAREQLGAIRQAEDSGGLGTEAENLPPCNHFLSFADFGKDRVPYEEAPATAEGTILRRSLWNCAGPTLGIYFRRVSGTVAVSFRYDDSQFKPYGPELLAKRYLNSLWTILTDWRQPLAKAAPRREELPPAPRRAEVGDKAARIKKALAGLEFFGGIGLTALDRLATGADFKVMLEGDRLGEADLTGKAFFLLTGRVARSLDPGDGWYYFLDMMKEGGLTNEMALLSSRQSKLALEVISEEARFLTVNLADVRWVINEEAAIAKRLIHRLLKLVEQYQRRWVQT